MWINDQKQKTLNIFNYTKSKNPQKNLTHITNENAKVKAFQDLTEIKISLQ
jgi:hypothetical protein